MMLMLHDGDFYRLALIAVCFALGMGLCGGDTWYGDLIAFIFGCLSGLIVLCDGCWVWVCTYFWSVMA